ncbi:RecF/RecN/SMC N terminal domain-containing protein [Andreprevotia lacus DSM 23236]|jgi:chromosome segregation ATPase|uniref:RecF/RecN/SMC N terminal domain-containing protein n=1 Tax=Andreprevotia lacus DSM 23236 TaxID=1121001 RepID=A0A1W1XZM8_9NEIS|nr:AAA family ATPase [Andreprevotia lacus]SMC28991.1 RecF/RecN/SMC N terminal domain-containing protein [Andreprevotia lacus DSM 23236]
MFQIRELEMVHWDFWRAIRVPLDAQIVTIVGPNGSGKTTLLDALRTLLALKCSGRRDYKRYVRNNRENYAWLRGVVNNPRRQGGGLFPYLFFPATSDEVTLFCRIRKQGGDWMRQYAIAEGNVMLDAETESKVQWLGVNEYKRRLEQAGLTPAIAEVLALEQGDTDKLCEYSPKALLELVFQVFGDKEVLDHYSETKLRLKEAEAELGKLEQQLSQLGLDVERLRLRSNSYAEWRALQDDIEQLEQQAVPALRYVEQWESLRGYINQFKGSRRGLKQKQDELDLIDAEFRTVEQQQQQVLDDEQAARREYDEAFAAFQSARDAARDSEKTLKEAERLRQLAELEHGADAVALNDALGKKKDAAAQLKHAIRAMKDERQQLSEAQFALQQGRQPHPDFVRTMRAALDEAGIAHQLLTEIVEVRDNSWQDAVEALLAPYRHIILLNRASDRARAWEIGQQLRFRHFIVPEREAAGAAAPNSILEIVDFKADAPGWLVGLLNRTGRAKSVADGNRMDGDWITRDGFHKERRGARDISAKPGDYAFGEAARHARLAEVSRRLRDLNEHVLRDEGRLQELEREVSGLTQSLMGMQAVVQLAARQDEFAAVAERFPEEEQRAQQAGAALAATQAAWEETRNAREDGRIRYEKLKDQRGRLDGQVNVLIEQLSRQRDEQSRLIRSLRNTKAGLPAEMAKPAALRELKEKYGGSREVLHMIEHERARLAGGDWETDPTILARRDKLAGDYDALERDTQVHRNEVLRTGALTDEARAAYINKLRATVRAYGRNVKRLGELAGIDVELDLPQLDNDDLTLAQAGLSARFNFDQKGMMGLNDGEASGGQQVMKSLILLIGLMMDDANPSGFVFIDEPFAHLDIFNIDRVGGFLKATQAQYLITTPLTHNTNVYGPSELTLTTRKKQAGEQWAPVIAQTRRRVRAAETTTG